MGKKKTGIKVEKKSTKKNLIKDFFYLEQDTKKLTYSEIVTTAFLYVFLSSFALIVSDKIYENITATKLYALISMFGIWFILMCVGLLEKIRSKKANAEYFKQAVKNLSVTDIALIAYTLVAFISTILSEYREVAFIGDKARNEGFLMQLLYISMFFMLSRTYVHKLELKIWALASIPVALIGILQLNGYYAGKFTYDILRHGRSFFTTLGNIDVVSTYLVTPIMICTVLYCQSKEKFFRILYFVSAGLCFYLSILIGVDSGFVGMATAIFFMFPFIAKDRLSASRIFHIVSLFLFLIYLEDQISKIGTRRFVFFEKPFNDKLFLGAIAAIIISVIIYFAGKVIKTEKKFIWPVAYFVVATVGAYFVVKKILVMPEPTGSSVKLVLYQFGQILQGNIQDHYGSNRIYAWRVAYRFFKEKPVIGHGPDTVRALWMREEYIYSTEKYRVVFDKAHNDYLQVLVTTGILGLTSYLVFQFSLLLRSFKKFDQPLVIALVTACICFSAQAFFNIGVPIVSPYGWILFGMLASILRKKEETA